MTTIDLYRKHKAGEVSREKFLYEVRRDNNLPFITNLTSYDDAVKILKNKGIVSEAPVNEATVRDLIKPLTSKLESMGYEVDVDPSFGFPIIEAFKTLPDGSVLRMSVQPSENEIQKKMGEPVAGETIDVDFTLWTTKVTKKFFGLYKQKSRDMQRLPDEAGINIDLGTGMFDIPVEQSVERVISLLKKAEVKVTQTSGNPLNEVDTKEAKAAEAVKAEVKPKKATESKLKELHIDQANPYEYRHGLAHELHQLGEYTGEALEKAKTTVLKNLAKDANFYSNLLNQQQSHYEFKTPESQDEKLSKKLDSGGRMEIKGFKNEKANVKDNLGKKEEGTTKPKGVKIMPDKGVTGSEKTIKEGIEDNSNIEQELEKALRSHDWYYQYSDDSRAWQKGQDEKNEISSLMKQLPREKAVELYNKYCPKDWKLQNEDKHTKIKEALKKGLKELINPKDIQAAKTTGDVVNIPVQDLAAQTAAKNAKINFRTYK
jgi:hypothetical protein